MLGKREEEEDAAVEIRGRSGGERQVFETGEEKKRKKCQSLATGSR